MISSLRLIVPSLLGAGLLAACGGQPAPAPQAPGPNATPTPALAATSAATATQAPAGGGGANAFADLMRAAQGASYKVTYKVTFSGGAPGAPGEQTVYVKGDKRRVDMGGGGPLTGASMFMLPDGMYNCVSLGQTGTCTKLPAGQATEQSNPFPDFVTRPTDYEATPAGSRTIAGQQAQCFTVKAKQPGSVQESTSCVTSSGVQVYMQTKTGAGEFTMEATSVTTSVSDADFQLPYPVGELPGIPGLGGNPGLPNVPRP